MEKTSGGKIKTKIKKEIARAYRHKRLIVGIISLLLLTAIYLFKDSQSITLRYSTFLGIMILFYLIDHLFYVRFEFKHYFFVIVIGVSCLLMRPLFFVYSQYYSLEENLKKPLKLGRSLLK